MPYILIYDFLFISNKRDIIKEDLNCNFPDWGCSEQMCTSILFWVTEVRCKILTPLETTGGNSFLLEGFKKCFLQFKTLRRVNHSSGGLQMSFQGVYKSTGGIQISIQGFINPLEGFRYLSRGFINPLEGFRYLSRGFINPLEGFRYLSRGL